MSRFVFFISQLLLKLQKGFLYRKIEEILVFVLHTKQTLSDARLPEILGKWFGASIS